MTGFGQLVIGPPGSGKTTYCNGIQHFFALAGRPCAVVNLDPANHNPPYECAVSIEELISLEEVQNELDLGPNGGMVYCMEYVAKNLDWLRDRVAPLVKEGKYLLFDLPGQVELFTSHNAVKQIIRELTASKATDMDLRLCTVHLWTATCARTLRSTSPRSCCPCSPCCTSRRLTSMCCPRWT